jgi:thiol-disulfide isomerase/thioredoxin
MFPTTILPLATLPRPSEQISSLPLNLSSLQNKVVLLKFFQVNCPGCFDMNVLPELEKLHDKYGKDGLVVLAIATAFEDYDLNTPANLNKLLTTGETVGETRKRVGSQVSWFPKSKFAVALDQVDEIKTRQDVLARVRAEVPHLLYQAEHDETLFKQLQDALHGQRIARTFSMFQLQGTPSTVLIDKKGNICMKEIGRVSSLETFVKMLLEQI